jgi:hypothetical protein
MDQKPTKCQNTFYYCRKYKDSDEWECKNNKEVPYEFRKLKPKITESKIIYAECDNGIPFEELVKNELGSNTKFFDQNYRCNEKRCLWKTF